MHALQGDGVVDQTAIETTAEDLEIRYDLHKQVALRDPLGETDTAWILIGFAANLDDALVRSYPARSRARSLNGARHKPLTPRSPEIPAASRSHCGVGRPLIRHCSPVFRQN